MVIECEGRVQNDQSSSADIVSTVDPKRYVRITRRIKHSIAQKPINALLRIQNIDLKLAI